MTLRDHPNAILRLHEQAKEEREFAETKRRSADSYLRLAAEALGKHDQALCRAVEFVAAAKELEDAGASPETYNNGYAAGYDAASDAAANGGFRAGDRGCRVCGAGPNETHAPGCRALLEDVVVRTAADHAGRVLRSPEETERLASVARKAWHG